MQQVDPSPAHSPATAGSPREPARRGLFHWRFVLVYLLIIGIVLMAILPPLLNVNRFKRRIVTSISASIGRPVHLDNVALVLLPFPGFKLENFVVEEDPAFGAEPVIRANNVVATLRFSSLWRRKVEFSRISLQEPSINLVHMPSETARQGKWNVESILLQAARIPAAPTAQAKAGPDPRFPYIEATGARVNVKYGDEKLPFSLTEADFALWLPRPMQWRVRIEGKPTRTDTSASDTGIISLEGTLDRAERFDLIPIELSGEWKNVPLGEASRVVTGRDIGLRGDLRLSVSAKGTIGSSVVKTALQLRDARRAEFVPPQTLDLRAECQATATETFHALHEIRCSWPPPADPSLLALTAELADIHKPGGATLQLGTPGLPAATLLEWLRVASPRVSPDATATGTLTGSIDSEPLTVGISGVSRVWSGKIAGRGLGVKGGQIGDTPIVLGDVAISSETAKDGVAPVVLKNGRSRRSQPAPARLNEFVMSPATLTLGGKEPALLEGHFDTSGYTLHLAGNVLPSRLLALAAAIPQFGDGLSAVLSAQSPSAGAASKELPVHVDVTSTRLWGGGQSWAKTAVKPARPSSEKRR